MANGTFRIARNRGGAQLPIALLAALAVALILIGKAQSTLFDRTRAAVTDWAAPALQVVRAPLVGLDRWMGSIGEIFSVYQENLKLKDENARLRQWRNAAIVLDDRVKRYQLLLRAVPDPSLSSVMARVIGRSNQPFLQTMILDAGRRQGIKPGQAVSDARGMIGRIFLTGQHTSWVILLTDLNSRIPVTIEPGNVQAIMAGDNTTAPTLDLLSQNVVPKAGAQVVSSGDGGLLPPGLAIGTVVADRAGGFRVVLLADSSSSEDVNVVDFKLKTEKPPAPSPSDLPATAAGLPPAAPPSTTPQPAPFASGAMSPAPARVTPVAPGHAAAPPASAPPAQAAPPAPRPDETAPDNGNE